MLSVCIPVYNFPVEPLVRSLLQQAAETDEEVEILLIDDASDMEYREKNQACTGDCRYIQLDENIGRARIRNLFLEYARFSYLLFLDCDSLIVNDGFLEAYLKEARRGSKVVCGGRVYPEEKPGKQKMLRWKYGISRESRNARIRSQHPYKSFMTNNFMLRRSVLAEHPFEESLLRYGHEDTLFGFRLEQGAVVITHIENPVLNGDLEDNALYLEKTAIGIANLKMILSISEDPDEFARKVRVLKVFMRIRKLGLEKLFSLFCRLWLPGVRRKLLAGRVTMLRFDLFKLASLFTQAHSE